MVAEDIFVFSNVSRRIVVALVAWSIQNSLKFDEILGIALVAASTAC
jgi:hypothetical protein